MRTLVAVLVVCCVVVVVQSARQRRQDSYNTQYDNVNLKDVLENDRLFESYEKCLLDKGPCTQDGKLLREAVPDALTNGCSKCNDVQKEKAKVVIKFLREKKPATWQNLKKKHDPQGVYEKQYQKELEQL